MKRKSASKKIKAHVTINNPLDINSPPFHEFFPITLFYKDGKDKKYCYFVCEDHLKKYLTRNKLKKGSFSVYETEPKIKEEN